MARRSSPSAVRPLLVAVAAVASLLVLPPVATAWWGSPASASAWAAESTQDPPDDQVSVPGPVVLVGTAGLRWSDVDADRTPALWRLLEDGASGTVAARSIRAASCPVDGWLAVSSGRLAADASSTATTAACNALDPAAAGAQVPRWSVYLDEAGRDERGAVLGSLGEALAAADVPTVAIGPGAAIAIASTDGVPVGSVLPAPETAADLTNAVRDAATAAELVVVDIGSVEAPGWITETDPASRSDRITAIDAWVSAVVTALPPDATVLVASLAGDGAQPHLQLAQAHGPGIDDPYASTLLGSRSTRQPGLVQVTDVTPTLLSLLGVAAPSTLVGSPIAPLADAAADPEARLQALRGYDAAAVMVEPYVVWFGTGLVALQLLMYSVGSLALRRRWGSDTGRARVLGVVRWLGVGLAAVPVATYPADLVPWWRSPAPFWTLMAAVGAGAAVVTLVAMLGPWRHRLLGPFTVVCGVTALVLTVDVVTGSRLMIASLLGLQPLVAGRFYGLGNVAFALFASGALLVAAGLADRLVAAGRRATALAAVVIIGAAAVVIDGAPGLGSDFGGPLALIPAFAVLAVLVAQLRASWRGGIGVAAATVAVVAGLSLLDWLRPPDERTHLGRFVEAMANGETWQVIGRKLEQNVGILIGSPLGLLVPVVACVLALVVVRPARLQAHGLQRVYDRAPFLRPGLLALLVLLAISFVVNDSGAAVPAVSAALVVPLLVSVCATAAQEGDAAVTSAVPPAAGTVHAQDRAESAARTSSRKGAVRTPRPVSSAGASRPDPGAD